MKKLVAVSLITALAAGAFTGCGALNRKDIGKDEALEIALQDAGITESDTTRLRISSDRDDFGKIYEVSFHDITGGYDYEYEISASDGVILSTDMEDVMGGRRGTENETVTDAQDGQADAGKGSGQGSENGSGNGIHAYNRDRAKMNVAISEEAAKAIVLERVPGATERDLRMELDCDDGVCYYEGEIIYEQIEYEFEVDANSGTVLSWKEEQW